MPSSINFTNHVRSLSNTMYGMNRILYVGTDYDISKYPALCSKRWRCIYTASCAENLADSFSQEGRQVRLITSKADYDAVDAKLDRNNPMLIYLNGVQHEKNEPDDIEAELEREEEREAILSTLDKLLRCNLMVDLVIVGYDPDNPNEITPKELARIIKNLGENHVSFYGMCEEREKDRYIQMLEEKGLIQVFEQDLGEVMEKLSIPEPDELADGLEAPVSEDNRKNIVYINGEPKSLTPRLCSDFKRFGRLLTLDEMTINPISRMMQPEYFYRFLKRSPNEPQWYGYARKNGFAVEREYEKELYKAVREGIESGFEVPVILAGRTSTGKSIALAALAYRLFQERTYAVIYYNNPKVSINNLNSPAGIALDNMLKEIRDLGGRAVVILDWSVYNIRRNDIIRRISDSYINRGHNVLFVASVMCADKSEKRYRVIQTPDNLSDQEKRAFKDLMVEKGRLQQNRVERWMNAYSNENGLLSMLYRLVYELHPQLERGIKKEIDNALDNTRNELSSLPPPAAELRQPMTALAIQLIKAGYATGLPDKGPQNDPEQQRQDILDSIRPFSECLAVSTLHKLRMPMTMAMRLLKIPDCPNKLDYRDTIFNAPWLYCAMDNEYAPGEYFVSFRDPMDARIYLNSIHMDEPGQLKVVAEIIKSLKGEQGSYYGEEVRFLEHLIRIIGPNSEDPLVSEGWRNTYGPGCIPVIETLRQLREVGIVEPQLVAQEITYIREYYAQSLNNDSFTLSTQIHWLEEAIQIARSVCEMAEGNDEVAANWQHGLVDAITVESIFSEIRLEKCTLQAQNQGLEIPCSIYLHTFREKYDILLPIIEGNPENSYPYTALIEAFLFSYEEAEVTEDMLSDMTDVLAVVDATESAVPTVEQNEHYQRKKNLFLAVFDRVFEKSTRVEHYFDELLSMGSPVGIYMKARAILRKANVDYNQNLPGSRAAEKACAEALELLENKKYKNVVEDHPASQYLRLQLTWLIRNKQPLFAKERQTTHMQKADWEQLYHICRMFKENFCEIQLGSHYLATAYYVLALSCAQLKKYTEALKTWRDVPEEALHTANRQQTWHILCDPQGRELRFNGTFNRLGLADRRIYVKEIAMPVLYRSLQSINMTDRIGDADKDSLCIGTSYRGFSVSAIKRS